MRVLELGNYVSVAYAGMILAEQGMDVAKWHNGNDPICGLYRGDELWQWINEGKNMVERHVTTLLTLAPDDYPDIIIDNFRPTTLEQWGINPAQIAEHMHCVWVSLRSEVGDTSFDIVAQMRSTAEYVGYLPFYLGDTSGGLWLAFKALAMHAHKKPGHYVLGQASCMQKLIEGELVVTPSRTEKHRPIWDRDGYFFDEQQQKAVVRYKGREYHEPVRDTEWKYAHLWHDGGRMRI